MRVKLKKTELVGTLDGIYLKADPEYYRPNDLLWVQWDDGRRGIVEMKDLIILDE